MIKISKENECSGCQACRLVCPVQAIIMVKMEEGFFYPKVDMERCIQCKKCENTCPIKFPAAVSKETEIMYGFQRNIEKRIQSSSGGIFSALAEMVLKNKGMVFGAAFDAEWGVCHQAVSKIEELHVLKGSKYLQSDVKDTYNQAKDALEKGKQVLYSGTPCQIQGLVKFLGKSYQNLITVDLVCHGVPSPDVWKKYLSEVCRGRKPQYINMRDQSNGIGRASMTIFFANGDVWKQKRERNLFLRGFGRDLFLRPACYECRFKGVNRCSDITIGDFWGIEKQCPNLNHENGISLVMIHSENGKKKFNELYEELESDKATLEIVYNPCIEKSVKYNPNRVAFFSEWKKKGVSRTVKKLEKISLNERSKQCIQDLFYSLHIIREMVQRTVQGK